jgi:EmrB/QacA subfamily drug resistance transporter
VSVEAPAAGGSDAHEHQDGGEQTHSGWLLAVCCIAQFMVILDLSIVNVALPSIQLSLGFSSNDLQWVVDGYTITFAGFLLLGGRAADAFGQRRMFVAALTLFSLTSLVGGLAPTSGGQTWLVAARAAQGLAGALMAASSLAIITSSFPPGPKLHRAVSTWAAMNGLGGAAGVLFGGIITQALTWRWILLINPPIGLVTALIAYRVVLDRRSRQGHQFDVAGALMLTIGQMVLVYGVVEAGLIGWSAAGALVPIIVGFTMLGGFAVIEMRFAAEPLVPFKELTKPLQAANNVVILFSAALFPMWLVSSLYLQQVLGLSPLQTGLIMLPMALTIMAVASRAGRLVNHFGVRPVLCSGLLMMTTGLLLLSRVGSTGSGVIWVMIPGILVAAGIAMSIVPSTIAATQGARPGKAGLASGIVNTSRQVGGGLGIAFLVTIATQRSSVQIGHGVEFPQALTDGFRLAYLIAAGLCAAAFLVAVKAMPRLGADHPGKPLRLASVVGVLLVLYGVGDVAFANSKGAPIGAFTTAGTYHYVTAPDLHPPEISTVSPTSGSKLAPGYILMANFYNINYPPITGQSGPLIVNDKLQPVWFKPVPVADVAGNLALQSYDGKPALSYWQGVITNTGATEAGEDVVVNQRYRTVATLRGKDGWKLTLHEFLIRGDDAWVTANKDLPYNLSQYGGAYNGAIEDSAVQEYDLKSGRLLFSWDALKHIPPGESYATLPTNGFPWDAYHVNSIDVLGNGTFLVSMRDTWAAYLVNSRTGQIIWTLGGRHSSFKVAKAAAFEWQHDVDLQPGGEVTMFDDHCCQLTGGGTYVAADGYTRALVLKLDLATHTASYVTQYGGGGEFPSVDYMGDLQPLANGNVFVGWGSDPYITEFTKGGLPLLEAKLPGSDLSYRAYLEPWSATPYYPPAGAARGAAGKTTVYASWNGATQVASWRVLAGSGTGAMKPVASAAKRGFETAIPVPGSHSSYEVAALNAAGAVIGTSARFSAGS